MYRLSEHVRVPDGNFGQFADQPLDAGLAVPRVRVRQDALYVAVQVELEIQSILKLCKTDNAS